MARADSVVFGLDDDKLVQLFGIVAEELCARMNEGAPDQFDRGALTALLVAGTAVSYGAAQEAHYLEQEEATDDE